jgi:hypothetical protein
MFADADVFERSATQPPAPQQQRCLRRLLDRALGSSRFARMAHLRIMQQADAHVRACDHREARAVTTQGPGGDLYFVLRAHRLLFAWRAAGA